MIAKTKRLVRWTGASLALMVALALGAGPVLAAQEKIFKGCLGEAVEDYGECLGENRGFWGGVTCTAILILDVADCVGGGL